MSKIRFETKALHSTIKSHRANNLNLPLSAENVKFDSEVLNEPRFNFEYPMTYSVSNKDLVGILCELENMQDGILCSSGELALYQSIMGLTKFGDHILISKTCSLTINRVVTNISQKMGVSFSFFDLTKPQKWESSVRPNTKLILIETLSVPSLEIPNLKLLREFSNSHSLILIADNSFCTPFIQIPSEFGVDCVLYSNSLYLEGQSNIPTGVILGSNKYIQRIRKNLIENEFIFSAFNNWMLLRGLETLAVRMEKHSLNALKVAEYLEKAAGIEKVKYPFLLSHPSYDFAKKYMKFGGAILCFSMDGGVVRGKRFIESLKKISVTHNPSIRTTINHPASTSYLSLPENLRIQMGARSNLIRLSIGLEHIDDILEEIDMAISNSKITFKLYKKGN